MVAAFFAAAPWLGCVLVLPFWRIDLFSLRFCTFGAPVPAGGYGVPGFTGPYWGNLLVGIGYLIATFVAAFTKRSL